MFNNISFRAGLWAKNNYAGIFIRGFPWCYKWPAIFTDKIHGSAL